MLDQPRSGIVAMAALVLLSAACSADDPPQSPAPSAESPATDAGADTAATESTDEDIAATTSITVDGGQRPTVSWQAVDGAATYRVTVLPDEGQPWAWEGTTTSVVLGGGEQDGSGLGYRLTSAAVITVTAHDADGAVLRLDQSRIEAPDG